MRSHSAITTALLVSLLTLTGPAGAEQKAASKQKCTPLAIRDAHANRTVPDLSGCRVSEVLTSIKDFFNLTPSIGYRPASTPATGSDTIIGQSPMAGPLADGPLVMTLFLAEGPPVKSTTAADLAGSRAPTLYAKADPRSLTSSDGDRESQVAAELQQAEIDRDNKEKTADMLLLGFVLLLIVTCVGIGGVAVFVLRRPAILPGPPKVECEFEFLNGALQFIDPKSTVLSAPAFDWTLAPSAARLLDPLKVTEVTVTDGML